MDQALTLRGVERTYRQADKPLPVLRGVSFGLRPGEIAALTGPSGAGKSTLLHIAGLLEKPDGGTVLLGDRDCGTMNDEQRTAMRRDSIGFVYQFHHLLPEFSAVENVMLPQMIAGLARGKARERAMELLAQVGLTARAEHRPARLSGGEQQRVAIARAVVARPDLLIADEPTGNVDPEIGARLIRLFGELNRLGTTVLIATHDRALIEAARAREMRLVDGRLVELRTPVSAAS
jgi:lipoprotein-releasing system ATP-binding protein